MPLPPALASRLAKRGLVSGAATKFPLKEKKPRVATDAEEEVIAENYDNNYR
ncbi:unnamed protein product, partial [Nesidiocoris tenuis]